MIRIKRNFLSALLVRVPKTLLILLVSLVAVYLIVFTQFAPDVYVFHKWVWTDNIARDIGLFSLLNNNFVFDLSTIIFDGLHIQGPINYLIAIIVIYLIVFYLKYFHFLADLSISRLLLVFTASFLTYDINQLRFQASLLFLLYSFSPSISSKRRLLLRGLSFPTHILPLIVFYTSRFRYLPLLFLPGLIALMGVYDSRFSLYFISEGFAAFKVFALIIPNLLSCWHYRKNYQRNQIAELAIAFTFVGTLIVPFFGLIAARFLESGFLLFAVWWGLCGRRSRTMTGTLWFFALTMLVSRLVTGINSGNNEFFFNVGDYL